MELLLCTKQNLWRILYKEYFRNRSAVLIQIAERILFYFFFMFFFIQSWAEVRFMSTSQQPKSLNLAPGDYHLFKHLQIVLGG